MPSETLVAGVPPPNSLFAMVVEKLRTLRQNREVLIVHDSYYRIIMNLCRQQGSAEYLVKFLKALGDDSQRQRLLAELERLAF